MILQKLINTFLVMTLISLSFSPAFGQTHEIKQDKYAYKMPVTQTVTTETFLIVSTGTDRAEYIESASIYNNYFALEPDHKKPNVSAQENTTCLPTAYFQLGSPILMPAEADGLLSTISRYGISTNDPLVITGYTCPLGHEQRNQTLSLKRARAVAYILRKHGYTVATVQGKGSQHPITNKPKEFFKNRRVEIRISR